MDKQDGMRIFKPMNKAVGEPVHRMAVFDIGSNTVKVLAVEAPSSPKEDYPVLLELAETTRLGEGIRRDFELKPAAMRRTIEVLLHFKQKCRALGVEQCCAFATSALRDAANSGQFDALFQKAMGFPFRILHGNQEAELIFRGAVSDPRLAGRGRNVLVMDVGGGSAEWIKGKNGQPSRCVSLNLGCVRMTERFLRGDPFTEESWQSLMAHYREELEPLRRDFALRNGRLIGTGGSISVSMAVHLHFFSTRNPAVHGAKFTLSELHSLLDTLRRMTQAQRILIENLSPKRADIIVAGLSLFAAAMETFKMGELTVSLRGLRYGALSDPSFFVVLR
ncbi:MAG: Ppx/GppA phosphatase family protein [Verrucomicrobiae bacterium]|nr:Ppx/GppA phosphatase family protein [Verrucomicrobiae bacterium]